MIDGLIDALPNPRIIIIRSRGQKLPENMISSADTVSRVLPKMSRGFLPILSAADPMGKVVNRVIIPVTVKSIPTPASGTPRISFAYTDRTG